MTQDVCQYLQYLTYEINAENGDVLYRDFFKGALYYFLSKNRVIFNYATFH